MIFFGLRRIARPAVGELIMVGALMCRVYVRVNARMQKQQ